MFNTDLLKHQISSLNSESFNIVKLPNILALNSMKNFRKTSIISNNKDKCISIWGKFMGSILGYKRLNKIQRSMYNKLTPFQFSVVIGLLLSDGSLSKGTNKNARLQFKQSLNKFYYFFSVFNSLLPYCSSMPLIIISTRTINMLYSIVFFTLSLPCFTELYDLFYFKGKKIVPLKIFNMLDSIALAHWIAGDGAYQQSGGLLICCDSFTLREVILLINVLIYKFELNCTLRQNKPGQYRIYILSSSMPNLKSIVSEYLHPSMWYKIHM